jgi:four helix bundle protein
MAVKDYCELIAWQKAMDLVEMIYCVTKSFPRHEIYGLTCQIRRAAVSVPSNIAEGQGRQTTSDFLHFLAVAHGSLNELSTQVVISCRLEYVSEREKNSLLDLATEVTRLLRGLQRALRTKTTRPNHPN